jgi:hypothetical protein
LNSWGENSERMACRILPPRGGSLQMFRSLWLQVFAISCKMVHIVPDPWSLLRSQAEATVFPNMSDNNILCNQYVTNNQPDKVPREKSTCQLRRFLNREYGL